MSNIISKEESIDSCNDFELDIGRYNKVRYKYSYPESTKLKGIVFIIAGFGADTDTNYSDKLRNYIAEKFSVVAVNVFYHCFYSRPDNGANIEADHADSLVIQSYVDKYNLDCSAGDSVDDILDKLDIAIKEQKNTGNIDKKFIANVPMTIFAKNDEYQNFGILQALDHLNVLKAIEKKDLNFEDNYSVTMMGSSHGGYIAYLCAKLAPQKIDCVIDNSSYVKPPYDYIVGKEHNHLNPEATMGYKDNINLCLFVKTNWTLDKNSKNYFSNDRYRIRDITDSEHLRSMDSFAENKTKYISYHSVEDEIAPIENKTKFYDELNKLGFDAKLYIIHDSTSVDGKFIKNLHHGMDMSLKELANRELPNALNIKSHPTNKDPFSTSYECDTIRYKFELSNDIYTGKNEPIQNMQEHNDEELTSIAISTYKNNLEYFEKHQKSVYEKLAALDSAIEQNHYQNRYDLIIKDGYFDVLEFSSGNYLYNSNSNDYAANVAESIDFEKNANVFETFKKVKIDEEKLKEYAKVDIDENNLSGFAPILHYLDKNKISPSSLEKIKKFIFFGAGLGGHIVKTDKKIDADIYLIIEDDLELFKLSLFTCPYYELARKSKLVFSVFDTNETFSKTAEKFINDEFYNNHYIKYFQMLSHNEDKLKEFHIKTASQSHNLFYYDSILKQYTRPLDYLKNSFNFLNILKLNSKQEFDSKPVILLAAGPSLQKNIEWIKNNQDRFIIVALSSTLSILEKNEISPDIVTHLDGLDNATAHFKKLRSLEFLKDTTFLLSARTQRVIVDLLNKEHIFFFENGTKYKKDFGNLSAPCVGSTSYLLLLLFNIQELYLLGLDLALDSKTGSTHSSEHEYTKQLDLNLAQTHQDTLTYKHSVLKTAGNFQEEVFTTPEYKLSIDSISTSSQNFKVDTQNVYNLNEGASFINTISTQINTINLDLLPTMDKTSIKQNIHNIFTSSSSNKITNDELKSLEEKKDYCLQLQNIILIQETHKFDSHENFLDALISLESKLTKNTSLTEHDLSLVYKNYFKFIYTFIFDFFNTKELKYKESFVDDINHLLSTQLLRIVKKYEKDL